MTQWAAEERGRLHDEISGLIGRLAYGERDDPARDALLARLLAYQAEAVEPYGRLVRQADPQVLAAGYPALPTDVFRYVRVASFPQEVEARTFRTSGTTQGTRGMHAFADLSLYDQAAQGAGRFALFPDVSRMRLVVLAPDAAEAHDSSLSYMLTRFCDWFGDADSTVVWRAGALQVPELIAALRKAEVDGAAVALLGTSFAFVHAEDALGAQRFALPAGSRIMQTGGYKGRSRVVAPAQLQGLLADRYGVPPLYQAQEYGMTELSSQMYSAQLREAVLGKRERAASRAGNDVPIGAQRLWVPPWVRVQAVDPVSLQCVPEGEVGLLRIDDLANLDSVAAIQTADMACVRDGEVWLVGRSPEAVPRGCSLAIEEALGWHVAL